MDNSNVCNVLEQCMQWTLNLKGRTAMRHMPGPEVNVISILVDLDAVPIKFAFHHNFLSTKLYTFYKIYLRAHILLFPCVQEIQQYSVCQVHTFFQASSTLETLAANCGRTALPTSISWHKGHLRWDTLDTSTILMLWMFSLHTPVHLQKTTYDCHHVNWNC